MSYIFKKFRFGNLKFFNLENFELRSGSRIAIGFIPVVLCDIILYIDTPVTSLFSNVKLQNIKLIGYYTLEGKEEITIKSNILFDRFSEVCTIKFLDALSSLITIIFDIKNEEMLQSLLKNTNIYHSKLGQVVLKIDIIENKLLSINDMI